MSSWDELQHLEVDGYRLAYRRGGSGAPVVLVHGVTTSSFIWRRVFPLLTPRYDVLAVDLLGCGRSDKPPAADLSVRAQTSLLQNFLSRLDLGPVHLVGHDVGGAIAQLLAVRSPSQLASVAVVNTVGYDYWPVQPIVTLRTPVVRQIAMATLDLGMLKVIVRRGLNHKDRATAELLGHFHEEIGADASRKPFLQFLRSLNNRDLMDIVPELPKIKLPFLIVRGDGDVYLSPEISRRLHHDIEGSKLVHIETAGHFVQEDEPELLAQALTDHFGNRSDG
ncbi:MAG: alpha/beta fold hydrolase [Thermoanaerobaculia bacterium]